MSKQHHDIGYQKRKKRPAPTSTATDYVNPDALAKQLVRNGLATPRILGLYGPATRHRKDNR